ncbi:hypothetical protein QQ020_15590 [Fulvivirgaceae bacterium BMA12]|uniref:Uncharacterized protein n=1 Tax=Agaribacillus aureus TaxID=3051825 RepID=A0ABT8L6W5_9BACT|nr:hypothetical protein [Fulvivirgaceae bacterium BMA12]
MNQEELFGRLMKNQISRDEFECLLKGMDDENILAVYETYLKSQFEKEVNEYFEKRKHRSKI